VPRNKSRKSQHATKQKKKKKHNSTHFQSVERFSRAPDVARTVATETKRIKTSMMVVEDLKGGAGRAQRKLLK
jgi:hypothetical protein